MRAIANLSKVLEKSLFVKSTKIVLLSALLFATPFFVSVAQAEEKKFAVGDIPYFMNALYVKDVESNLYRYKAAMVTIENVDNREDFLVYRDELWGSREDLSFAVQTLSESNTPYSSDNAEIANMVQEILQKCETFANSQNEIVAIYAKIKDLNLTVETLFRDIKDSEQMVGKRQLSLAEDELFIKVSNARSIYEVMLTSFLGAKSAAEAGEIVPQLQKALINYDAIAQESFEKFPELTDAYAKGKKLFASLFVDKGLGNLHYNYLVKKEEQQEISKYFEKQTKDTLKKIKLVQAKIRMKLE